MFVERSWSVDEGTYLCQLPAVACKQWCVPRIDVADLNWYGLEKDTRAAVPGRRQFAQLSQTTPMITSATRDTQAKIHPSPHRFSNLPLGHYMDPFP